MDAEVLPPEVLRKVHPGLKSAAVGAGRAAPCKAPCSGCKMRALCLPVGLTRDELECIDSRMVSTLRKVHRGEPLFRAGDRFEAVFAIWTGFFKSVITSSRGYDQVMSFDMCGDLIGLDGIDTGRHQVDAVALEDSQVCVVPYDGLEDLASDVPALRKHLHRIMSREISTNHGVMLQLGSMHADERVAAFLLHLTHRLQLRGFSASSVLLRMSREEIGSFLGLKLETVSRTLSKFQASGLLSVQQRQLQIIDPAGLQLRCDGTTV